MREPIRFKPINLYQAGNVAGPKIYEADTNDAKTLEDMKGSPLVEYRFEPDVASDQWVVDPTGKKMKVRQININGIQFMYEVGIWIKIPLFVRNFVEQCRDDERSDAINYQHQVPKSIDDGGFQNLGRFS